MTDKKILIIPSIMVVIVLGWFFLLNTPFNKTIGQLTEQHLILEDKDELSISDSQVQTLKTEVDSLTRKLENNMARLYSEEQLLDLGRVIDNIGKQYGLSLVTIIPDYAVLPRLTEQQQKITVFPLNITFSGTFGQFTRFLDHIPNFPIVFQVESISLTKESGSGVKVKGEMRCKIVMRKENNENKQETQMAMNNQI